MTSFINRGSISSCKQLIILIVTLVFVSHLNSEIKLPNDKTTSNYSCFDYPSTPQNPTQGYYNTKKVCDYLYGKYHSLVEYVDDFGYEAYILQDTGNDGGSGIIEYIDSSKIKSNYMYENSNYGAFVKPYPIYTNNSKYYYSIAMTSGSFTVGVDGTCSEIVYEDGNEICMNPVYKRYPIYLRDNSGTQIYLKDRPTYSIADSSANFYAGYLTGVTYFSKKAMYATSDDPGPFYSDNITFNNIPVFYVMYPYTFYLPNTTYTYKNAMLQSITPYLYSYKYDSLGVNGLRGYYDIDWLGDYVTVEIVNVTGSSIQVAKNSSNKYFAKGTLKANIKILQRDSDDNSIENTYYQTYTITLSENVDFDGGGNAFSYSNTGATGSSSLKISCSGDKCISSPKADVYIELKGKKSEYVLINMWLTGSYSAYNPAIEMISILKI